jgi:hypothetical protein
VTAGADDPRGAPADDAWPRGDDDRGLVPDATDAPGSLAALDAEPTAGPTSANEDDGLPAARTGTSREADAPPLAPDARSFVANDSLRGAGACRESSADATLTLEDDAARDADGPDARPLAGAAPREADAPAFVSSFRDSDARPVAGDTREADAPAFVSSFRDSDERPLAADDSRDANARPLAGAAPREADAPAFVSSFRDSDARPLAGAAPREADARPLAGDTREADAPAFVSSFRDSDTRPLAGATREADEPALVSSFRDSDARPLAADSRDALRDAAPLPVAASARAARPFTSAASADAPSRSRAP